jgi:hypothetical protein
VQGRGENAGKMGTMAIRLEGKEKLFLEQLDEEGTARGNKSLRKLLGWGEQAYFEVRAELLRKGQIALGRGRGGSVKKAFGDDQVLLAAVPLEGSISNTRIIGHLGWSRDRYWEVRSRLIDEGQLVAGRGPGGAVSRVQDDEDEEDTEEVEDVPGDTRGDSRKIKKNGEKELYEPLVKTLKSKWAPAQRLEQCIVENCAHVKNSKGMWRNPDLLMAARRPYQLIVTQYLIEIWTFEVKLPGWNMNAIYEAEANGHGSTHTCALLQVDKKETNKYLAQCEEKASQLKIGLITFVEPLDVGTWNMRVRPKRRVDDFEKQNLFLTRTMTSKGQAQMKAWSRSGNHSPLNSGKMSCSD